MNIAFAGFRHGHIFTLLNMVKEEKAVNIVGCFEENDIEREKVETQKGIEFNYKTYDDVLNDKNVEVIAIGDYYGKRGQMVIEALKKDKHVICDKPICTSLFELDEIEKLSSEKGLSVFCMLDLRYMRQIETVKKMIENGVIGKVINVSFTGQHPLSYGSRPSWYFEEGKHGGTINDIAIHGVDLIRYLTGKNLTKVNCAKTWNAFADKEPSFQDCGQFMAEFEDVSVMADVSYASPKCKPMLPTYWDFYIWGKDGMIQFRLSEKVIHLYKDTPETIECPDPESTMLADFIKEINGIKTMMNTKDVLESQRQVLMIQKEAE